METGLETLQARLLLTVLPSALMLPRSTHSPICRQAANEAPSQGRCEMMTAKV